MMTSKSLTLLAFVLSLAFSASVAVAAPVDTTNTRPVLIQAPTFGPPVQTILDNMFGAGVVNANTDQSSAAIWQTSALPPFASTAPLLSFEYLCTSGGDCSSNDFQEFGVFTQHDTSGPITRVAIFNGSANPFTSALLQWTTNTSLTITGAGPSVNSGTFTGVEASFFGFYYKFGGTIPSPYEYSVDSLNSPTGQTQAAMLAYQRAPGSDTWALAFDGNAWQPPGTNGLDYNDLVVKVESITPVPEPEIYAMLAAGLGLMGFVARRRKGQVAAA